MNLHPHACPVSLAAVLSLAPAIQQAVWIQEARLDPVEGGFARALDLDGDTAVVGAPDHLLPSFNAAGAAVVFERGPGGWARTALLTPGDSAQQDGAFGAAVAVGGDWLAVGAPDEGPMSQSWGAVYLFHRDGSSWTLEQRLVPQPGSFGESVSLSGDTLLIGAPGAIAAHVYVRAAGAWQPEQVLATSINSSSGFGRAVAVDGNTALVGAPQDGLGMGLSAAGSAYVFERGGSIWTQTAELRSDAPQAFDFFGITLSVSQDAVAVGSLDAERVFVFERAGASWPLQAALQPAGHEDGDDFGFAVDVQGDCMLIGARLDSLQACWPLQAGSIFLFDRGPLGWSQSAQLNALNEPFGRLGSAVALDGGTLLAGAPDESGAPLRSLYGVEGLALDPATGALFGVDPQSGWLLGIDLEDGEPVAIGPLGFASVQGLTWDAATGTLLGADLETDQLVRIDPASGAGTVVGPFGLGGVHSLALDPSTGALFGGVTPCGASSGTLIAVDPATGAGTTIGALPRRLSLAFDPGSGRLFGADSVALYEIDPASGAGTSIGIGTGGTYGGSGLTLGPGSDQLLGVQSSPGLLHVIDVLDGTSNSPQLPEKVEGLAYDPGAGVLYATDDQDDRLAVFDLATGAGTYVGPLGFDRVVGLAFDPAAGVLYGTDLVTDQLLSIDPQSGQATALGPLGFNKVDGLAVDPVSGVLFGSTPNQLITIDVATGAGTPVAVFSPWSGVAGLAFDAGGALYGVAQNLILSIDPASGASVVIASTSARGGLAFALGEIYAHFPVLLRIDPQSGAVAAVQPAPGAVYAFRTDLAATYCSAGTSAAGCQAAISAAGAPSASQPAGFTLSAAGVQGQVVGLFFFGTSGRQASPWGNGTSYQCVVPPVQRAGLLAGTGSAGACDGAFGQDLNAFWCPVCPRAATNPGAGAAVQAQLWYRDPQSTSNQTTSLSDAVEFTLGP